MRQSSNFSAFEVSFSFPLKQDLQPVPWNSAGHVDLSSIAHANAITLRRKGVDSELYLVSLLHATKISLIKKE